MIWLSVVCCVIAVAGLIGITDVCLRFVRRAKHQYPYSFRRFLMKHISNMKLSSIFLLVSLLISAGLQAQTDFKPGYIIKSSGDTLHGSIDYRGDLLMSRVCKFRASDNTVSEYYPGDIAAYRLIDGKFYVTQEVDGSKKFLEYLIKGKVNIYYMRDGAGDHYYIDKDGEMLSEMPYKEEIRSINKMTVLHKSSRHVGLLLYYMQDAPDLKPKIESIAKPEHDVLVKIAEQYHNAVCSGEKCIIYEKALPLIRISPEIVGGIVRNSNIDCLVGKTYAEAGIVAHIWLPRTNEKVYFRTGVLYSQMKYEELKDNNSVLSIERWRSNVFKIPCQLEYIYPKGWFRPRAAYGFNLNSEFLQTVAFYLGANLKLNNRLFLSVTSEVECYSRVMIVPEKLVSYSFKMGVYLNIK